MLSTGIGFGVAIPHARCRGGARALYGLRRQPVPVPFDSIDGEPVRLFF